MQHDMTDMTCKTVQPSPEEGYIEIEDRGTTIHFVLGFQETSMQSLSAFL